MSDASAPGRRKAISYQREVIVSAAPELECVCEEKPRPVLHSHGQSHRSRVFPGKTTTMLLTSSEIPVM